MLPRAGHLRLLLLSVLLPLISNMSVAYTSGHVLNMPEGCSNVSIVYDVSAVIYQYCSKEVLFGPESVLFDANIVL